MRAALPALIIFALLAMPVAAGVGASPASITFSNLLRSGYAESYMTISNPGSEPVNVSVGIDGNVVGWLTATPSSLVVQPGAFAVVKLVIQPPADIPNGIYSGTVLVMSGPTTPATPAGGTSVAVASAVGVVITAEISEAQRLEYRVEGAWVPDTEECRPVQLVVAVRNTGNVRERARFDINILSSGSTIKSYSWTSDEMLPTKVYNLVARVPYELEQFRCIPVGSYVASFTAWLNDALMYTGSVPFKIWERGSLTVAGAITQLTVPQTVMLGESVRIDAAFHNTGQLPVLAKLKAEIYQKSMSDWRLVDTVESDEIDVNLAATETLTAYYKPGWSGDYKVKATVLFEGKSSAPAEAEFKVLMPTILMAGIGAALIIIIILVVLLWRRQRKKKQR